MEAYVIFREPAFNPWEVITKQGAKTFIVLLYAKQIAYPKMGDSFCGLKNSGKDQELLDKPSWRG